MKFNTVPFKVEVKAENRRFLPFCFRLGTQTTKSEDISYPGEELERFNEFVGYADEKYK